MMVSLVIHYAVTKAHQQHGICIATKHHMPLLWQDCETLSKLFFPLIPLFIYEPFCPLRGGGGGASLFTKLLVISTCRWKICSEEEDICVLAHVGGGAFPSQHISFGADPARINS